MRVLATGAVLLALVWLVGPRGWPPLYDGGPIIVEPYRYLHPPTGLSFNKRPSSVDATIKLENGQSPGLIESTNENPPQAELLAAQGSFALPPGATSVNVTVAAVDPPALAPLGGAVDGNVYYFAVNAGTKHLMVQAGQRITVLLRGPAGVANPILEVWDGRQWTRLDTFPLANSPDTYTANPSVLGDFALVAPAIASGQDSGSSKGVIVVGVIVAMALLAAAVVLWLRRS